jgi:hypothetical protein
VDSVLQSEDDGSSVLDVASSSSGGSGEMEGERMCLLYSRRHRSSVLLSLTGHWRMKTFKL